MAVLSPLLNTRDPSYHALHSGNMWPIALIFFETRKARVHPVVPSVKVGEEFTARRSVYIRGRKQLSMFLA